jgi:hypothetical protein
LFPALPSDTGESAPPSAAGFVWKGETRMNSSGLPELGIIVVLIFVVGLMLLPAIFYLLSLSKALERCAFESRTMSPGQVWLLLIPLFGMIWHFIIVGRISSSLRNEFTRRSLPLAEAEPGKSLGLAMCILAVTSVIPLLGIVTGIATLVCWIMYWVKITDYSRQLQAAAVRIPS